MLKHFQSLLPLLLLASSTKVLAQATSETPAAPGSSTGTEMGGGLNWLWILIALVVVIAVIWYFTKRRKTTI